MQQHNLRRPLKVYIRLIGGFPLLLLGTAIALAQCASPTTNLSVERVDGQSALEMFFALGLAHNICFGVELGGTELVGHPVEVHSSQTSALSAAQRILSGSGYVAELAAGGSVISIRPKKPLPATWLDLRIDDEFRVRSQVTVQGASYLLYMYLLDQIKPRGGFAGHYRTGDTNDVVRPFEVRGKTVRELLDLILSNSKGGGLWVTTAPYIQTPSDPDRFWEIFEYSDQRMKNGSVVRSWAQRAAAAFQAPALRKE